MLGISEEASSCSHCSLTLDRDVNAVRSIYLKKERLVTQSPGVRVDGDIYSAVLAARRVFRGASGHKTSAAASEADSQEVSSVSLALAAMIGICGGAGPAAGILLHQAILLHTDNQGMDQGHLNVCHVSCSAAIASRAAFLRVQAEQYHKPVNGSSERCDPPPPLPENPACGMARSFEMLAKTAQAAETPMVVGVPCVTFHVDAIWDEFLRLTAHLAEASTPVRCLHLLEETVHLIPQLVPHAKTIGVLSTDGTREARLFRNLLEPRGYNVVEVQPDVQRELQDTIQSPRWGIKSLAPAVHPRCVSNFHRYARLLIADGAELIVLGCTEIPMAFGDVSSLDGVQLLDPMVALARGLIREVDASRLKPLNNTSGEQSMQ